VSARGSRLYVLYVWVTSSPFSVGTRHTPFSILEGFKVMQSMATWQMRCLLLQPSIPIKKTSYGSLCGRGSDTRLASDGRIEDELSQWRNRLPR
jgi:hypothetical protein